MNSSRHRGDMGLVSFFMERLWDLPTVVIVIITIPQFLYYELEERRLTKQMKGKSWKSLL